MEDIDFAEVLAFTADDQVRAAHLKTDAQRQLLCAIARVVATVPLDQLEPDTLLAVLDDLRFNASELLAELDASVQDEFTNLPAQPYLVLTAAQVERAEGQVWRYSIAVHDEHTPCNLTGSWSRASLDDVLETFFGKRDADLCGVLADRARLGLTLTVQKDGSYEGVLRS